MVLRNAKPDFIEWELTGRQHPAASSVKRMTPPDEIAIAPSYLLGPESAFVNGSDLLTDRGVIAARAAAGDAVQRRALSAFGRQRFNLVSKPSRPQENRQENH